MKYLLDTNICIYLIKRRPLQVLERLRRCPPGDVGISSLTEAELRYGAEKSLSPERNHEALDQFLLALEHYPFDAPASRAYGSLRARLERAGTPIGPLDMLIAAHAMALSAILVSNNLREFYRVPDLRLENWAEPS